MSRRVCVAASIFVAGAATWISWRPLVGHAVAAFYSGTYEGDRNVIRQTGLHDCGVAALAMMFSTLGHPTRFTSLERLVSERGRGLSMYEMQQAAAAQGLALQGYHLEPRSLVAQRAPMVALVLHHYVLIESISATTVTVLDPIAGRIRAPITEFSALWSGYALIPSA